MDRRMNKWFAALMLWAIGFLHARMVRWQAKHPCVADYRVNDATSGLRDARRALDHLKRDAQYPEWYAARDALAATLDHDKS